MTSDRDPQPDLRQQIEALTARLEEADETIRAIRAGKVDAFCVEKEGDDHVLVLDGVDRPYRLLIERMQQGALTTDIDGTIHYANRRLADLLQVPLSAISGTPLHMHVEAGSKQAVQALLTDALSVDAEREVDLVRRDGVVIPVLITASTLLAREGILCLVVTDLTQQRRAESERERLFEAQAARVAAEETTHALREADRRKDEFLAMLAHELRGPLAPLRNGLEILDRIGAQSEEAQRIGRMMSRQITSLVRLVDDLLDVARVTHGKITLKVEQCDLRELVSRAIEAARPAMQERNHAFEVLLPREPVPVEADGVRISQAVLNLLANAAKFTPPDGRISIVLAHDGREALVRVTDDGIGLAPEMVERIFDLFAQVDSSTGRSQGGLGIGLTLARRIVELHGGRLSAVSQGIGHGSEFTLRLPLVAARPTNGEQAPPARKIERPTTTCRILVVDDNHDSAKSLGWLLQMARHEVRLAHDGLEAIAVARRFEPDLVLLDLGLPGMSGYDVARELRSARTGRTPRIVAVSGYGRDVDRQQTRAAGFDAHLVKPVDPATIEKEIAAASCRSDGQARAASSSAS